ncbi:MAG TPA: class I SAM-dependent methyltransferase [Candidatus Angelobacter sp.]
MSARIKSHIRDWQDMASFDPFLAISGQKKDWHVEEFWATAQPHMDRLFLTAGSLGLPRSHDRALEFGCGVGRFLPHFEKRFGEVWGLDVSPSMIDLAKKYNPRCRFHLNAAADLSFFPGSHFDLIYSFLVLQHLPDEFLIAQYLKEFMRILKPGGLAAFQIPDRLSVRWRVQPRRRIYHLLHSLGFSSKRLQSWALLPMSLRALSEHVVERIVSAAGGKVTKKESLGGIEGLMYYCTK